MLTDIFKEQTYFIAEYYEVDELIHQEYPQLSEFECALDQHNDSSIHVTVNGKVDDKDLNHLLETGEQDFNSLDLLLNDLCRKGKIKEGKYLISVSW
jgi:hypothetical protein